VLLSASGSPVSTDMHPGVRRLRLRYALALIDDCRPALSAVLELILPNVSPHNDLPTASPVRRPILETGVMSICSSAKRGIRMRLPTRMAGTSPRAMAWYTDPKLIQSITNNRLQAVMSAHRARTTASLFTRTLKHLATVNGCFELHSPAPNISGSLEQYSCLALQTARTTTERRIAPYQNRIKTARVDLQAVIR
jgi:hypothetical protein